MNENQILENSNIEVELEDLIQSGSEEILENEPLADDLGIELPEEELDTVEDSIENEEEPTEEISALADMDISEDETEIATIEEDIVEDEITELENEETQEDSDLALEEEIVENDAEEVEEVEQIQEESLALSTEEDIIEDEIVSEEVEDESFITNDLHNIDIEFGIEAKGFILSLNMMEAMIEKGYVFKNILNDKVFDAVMIFNGNLENTVMTSDIKIKIEDGKIQLIKG